MMRTRIRYVVFFVLSTIFLTSCVYEKSYVPDEGVISTLMSSSFFKSGSEVGYFSRNNINIPFVAASTAKTTVFQGVLNEEAVAEYSYLIYPYNKNANLEKSRNYYFSVPEVQEIDSYENKNESPYAYKVGYTINAKGSSSYEFEDLMAEMDIVVENNTESDVRIKKVVMNVSSGKKIFSLSASVELDPYNVDMNKYSVSSPTQSSLAVKVLNPTEIAPGRCKIIPLAFFPATIEPAEKLTFTIETNNGTYTVTKVIAGFENLNFTRGELYITPLSLE